MENPPKQLEHEWGVVSPELVESRLLTEVDHLAAAMDDGGNIPGDVLQDVRTNLQTGVYEMAMPLAVSTTAHRVEYRQDEAGRRQRYISWLGKSAVENALNGKRFHQSEAAHKRVDVEVDEAAHAQEHLRAGIAQAFISPKMSRHDAPAKVAKAEHLHDDDSLRVSYAITNSRGEVVGRRLESLLVRDIPLEAWVAMLKDPNNIFGKAFALEDEQSALPIMKLFRELELPEIKLPEGPVSLVAAVQRYIDDFEAYNSVERQLAGFRRDQQLYEAQAELSASEWLQFEIELARSRKLGKATLPVRAMIATLQDQWGDEQQAVIRKHELGNAEYKMTRELEATLEQAKRNLIMGKAGIATNNEDILAQLQPAEARQLHDEIRSLQVLWENQIISGHEYARAQAGLERKLAGRNLKGGGGCAGDASGGFRNGESGDGDMRAEAENEPRQQSDWEKGKRKWKKGKCQVKACKSPQPTEVGPCSVCKRCQAVFDGGGDPTKPGFVDMFAAKEPEPATTVTFTKNRKPKFPEQTAGSKKQTAGAKGRHVGRAVLALAA